MQFTNSVDNYGLIAKLIHWLIALLIIALLAIGWWMVGLSYYDPWYHDALSWHKSLGLIVGFVVIFKLLWSRVSAAPDPIASLKPFERLASAIVHTLLRLAMLLIPVTGYLVSTSEGTAIDLFGWLSIPALLQVNEGARDIAIEIHYYVAYTTAVLVILHIAAALKHHFVDRNNILQRML